MKKANWLDNHLIMGCCFTLCLNQKQYNQALKDAQVRKAIRKTFMQHAGADGCTETFSVDGCKPVCLVSLASSVTKKSSRAYIYGVLVHEAVHVWQKYRDWIGETNPSKEFEAHAIEQISYQLICAFNKQVKLL